MSVLSQVNWLGNQRVELQHLRAIDSYVQQDFEALSLVLAGSGGAVVSGLTITGGSTTGFTVQLANKGVVLAPVSNDAVFFANLTGSAITQTLTKGGGVGVSVYMNFYEVESLTSGGYLPLVNETTPMTFIDPNTKKAYTLDEATRRMVRVEFTTTAGAYSIEVAAVAVDGTTITHKNRLFAADSTSDAVPHTLKEYVDAVELDVSTLEGQMTTANGNISTLQGQMTTANTNISALQTGSYAKVEYTTTTQLTTTGPFIGWNSADREKTTDITISTTTVTDDTINLPAGKWLMNLSGTLRVSSITGTPQYGGADLYVNGSVKEMTTFGPVGGNIASGDRYPMNFSYILSTSASTPIRIRLAVDSGTLTPSFSSPGTAVIFTITKIGQ